MKIYLTKDYDSMSKKAAMILAAQVVTKPESVLGLATGSTPIGIYELLVKWCSSKEISFADVRTVNLDEYVGLDADNPQSYHFFMRRHLFDGVDIPLNNTYLPDGAAKDPQEECLRYERLLSSLGQVDIQLLGLGHNGHIGFNEPGDSFSLGTHVVNLADRTRKANSRNFGSLDAVPCKALTMGVGTIMRAKRILMVVSGADKAETVSRAFAGPITPAVPASVLQLHPDVTLVGDESALSCLLKEEKPL